MTTETPAAEPGFVQPIVLLVDKADPAAHIDGIHAAALASVLAYAQEILITGAPDSSWEAWLSGRFTKTVRRADAKTFEKLAEKFTGEEHAEVSVGRTRALAFRPVTYDAMSRHLARLQVSGTVLPMRGTDEKHPAPEDSPVLVLNSELGMSTGKAAAQGAHGLFAWFLTLDDAARRAWYDAGCPFRVRFATRNEFDALSAGLPEELLIVDAGLTEIAPNTPTAFVLA